MLAALLALDGVVVAVVVLSEGALHWLSTLPFLGGMIDRFGPLLISTALVQLLIVLVGCTAALFLRTWQELHGSHGGPKPNLAVAVIATCALYFVVGWYLLHDKAPPEQFAKIMSIDPKFPQLREADGPLGSSSRDGTSAVPDYRTPSNSQRRHLPAVFRLQRPIRGSVQPPQRCVVGIDVTEIELQTPVADASFKIFTLFLDDQELQGYQVRNGELSLTVDRQDLPPGEHTLAVREKQKGGKRPDVQFFEFAIVDAPR